MEDNFLQSAEFLGLMLMHTVARVSYFETSSSKVLTPIEALEEAKDAIGAYASEPEQTWRAIPYALKRVVYSVEVSTLGRQLQSLGDLKQLVEDIDQFHRQYVGMTKSRRGFVDGAVPILSRQLELAFGAVSASYPKLLIEKTMDGLSPERSMASNRDRIARIAPELCTYLNYQGRDVETLAQSVGEMVEHARGNSGYDLQKHLTELLEAPQRDYEVATVITGAINAAVPRDLRGETVRFPGPASWSQRQSANRRGRKKQSAKAKTSRYANSDLTDFCLEHWKTDTEMPNRGHRVSAQIVIWQMEAWDPIHARQLALDRAESFMDRINAEHRVGEFGVKRKVLVWERGADTTTYLTDVFEGPRNTRVMGGHRSPSVQRSLRLASRAANERAGAMAVFFGWAALEYLGRGNKILETNNKPMSPQTFIAKYVPKLIGAVALHHLANDVAHSIVDVKPVREWEKPLQRFLKLQTKDAPSDHVDQRNLFYFLVASGGGADREERFERLLAQLNLRRAHEVSAALTEFENLITNADPISRYRIRQVRHLLQSPERMAAYLAEVERSADVALQRMRYVRNQTAHSNIPESIRYETLSNAMREILDTCYQAIDKANASAAPHETLYRLALQYDELISDLRNGRSEKMFSPHRVLHVSK